MKKYRKKPVVIEAMCFDGENHKEVQVFFNDHQGADGLSFAMGDNVYIQTLEGTMTASKGDYIIKGINGEFYPCKPDIFAKTYDLVEPVDTQGGDAYREIMYNGWVAKQKAKEGKT